MSYFDSDPEAAAGMASKNERAEMRTEMFEKQSRRTGLDREVGGSEERAQTQSLRAQARWHRHPKALDDGETGLSVCFAQFARSPHEPLHHL